MKQVKAFNIKYDTVWPFDMLPSELSFTVDDEFDPSMELADAISDKTGWCVISFDFEWLT
jgi:hypothetical protein